MTITDSELLAIEARARAASAGDWAPIEDGAQVAYPEKAAFVSGTLDGVHGDVLRLVAEVRRLNEVIARMCPEYTPRR